MVYYDKDLKKLKKKAKDLKIGDVNAGLDKLGNTKLLAKKKDFKL